MKALFINSSNKHCSIHESGKMIFDCLKLSKAYAFDYIEIDREQPFIPTGYDLYLFNYHEGTMSWLKFKFLKKVFGYVMTIVLEIAPDDPFPFNVKQGDFNVFCVIDPTIKSNNKDIFSFPRPLERTQSINRQENQIPIIGSFGFPSHGKGFDKVVEAVSKEFDTAIVRINMPKGDFMPPYEYNEMMNYWKNLCNQKAKNGIKVEITSDFMDKNELIKWCSENTLNCFLYDRNCPGLSATTDQALASGAPLALSSNPTFRHILEYLKPYPESSLKDSIEKSADIVKKIQNDWSQEAFAKRFDDMIEIIKPNIAKNKLKKSWSKQINLKKEIKKQRVISAIINFFKTKE